eukprot:scaffold40390_cov26-Tisochrysis_lutea.AAC.3
MPAATSSCLRFAAAHASAASASPWAQLPGSVATARRTLASPPLARRAAPSWSSSASTAPSTSASAASSAPAPAVAPSRSTCAHKSAERRALAACSSRSFFSAAASEVSSRA